MPQLTDTELEKLSTEELRALALKEAEPEPEKEEPKKAAVIDTGKEVLDNSEDEEPETTVYRKEIDLGEGDGIQVFEGESLEELVDKLAEAQRNATKKIREFNLQKKAEDARTAQQKQDDEFVIAERLQKEPTKTVRQIVAEVIAEREAATQAAIDAQSRFVQTHPDFIANPKNANEMQIEVQRLGYTDFTYEGLEKAYQNLKLRGILQLKAEGSEEATKEETKETPRIEETKAESAQPRSPKRSSNLSTRTAALPPKMDNKPTLDEAYDPKFPMEKLKDLANQQLAEANG